MWKFRSVEVSKFGSVKCGRVEVDLEVWTCGSLAVEKFESVKVWKCGSSEVWKCGSVDV